MLDSIGVVVGVLATVASVASIYVSLYVKSCIGPIVARQETHAADLERHRRDLVELWKEQRAIGERLARLETSRCEHCKGQ